MGRKPKIQTRVERDTKDAIDRYVEGNESVSQSEAVRHLIRAGLAEKGYPVAVTDGAGGGSVRYLPDTLLERIGSPRTIGIATVIMLTSGLTMLLAGRLATTGDTTLAAGTLILTTVLMTTATLLVCLAALAQIALARPLRGLVGLRTGETA